ncbi:(5-formylfuran-3-yl)methyl phosphate synthase [Hyphomicrobium sp.]|uniref:(5-formylfuran-3-yl)methyl phosphate synthase n=1 Tax=Hyphomicrobium sp. TaxID=82 RepID=UPI0025C188F3|nr:(5-formylfuran-3-yl)methyl phosphate synthase [Hyphomicrobium sp.]
MAAHRFVRLLASVASEAEARLAAAGSADIIDAKNPASGALGALPVDVVSRIRKAVPAHILVSATVGDLPAEPEPVVAAARAMATSGCDIVKVGLFPGGDPHATIRHLGRHIAQRTPLVAVLMADAPLDLALVPLLGEAGFRGVMLDTASKDGRTLLDHRTPDALRAFVAAAHEAGLFAGLAGSLRLAHIPELLALAPDVLGFRGALCRASDRRSTLDTAALAAVRDAIPQASRQAPAPSPPLWGRPGGGESQTPAFRAPSTHDHSPQGEGEWPTLETTP